MRELIQHFAENHPELYSPLLLAIGLAVEKFYAPETEMSP